MSRSAHPGMARRAVLGALAGWAAAAALPAGAASAPAVLSAAALLSPKALGAATLAVTRAGQRLVAVGERGTVLLSDDHGVSWKQAPVPVQATLTCVRFANDKTGWAAGHLGVILRSDDAGASWHKQLDGLQAAALMLQAAQATGDDKAIANAQRWVEEGADKPFFDLEFIDAQRGFAVGAYGLIFATLDGGKTWASVAPRLPNPKSLHLYGLRAHGQTLLIAGEQGLLLRSTDGGLSFSALTSPYKGSFFGLLHTAGDVWVAYGLRGSAYRSLDAGTQWEKLDTGVPMTVGAGTALPKGGFVLLSQAGDVLLGRDEGPALKRTPAREPLPVSGVAIAVDGSLVLASLRGMRRLSAPSVN
ncbi:WD40/YVTN/BNR-like repeat-containing protein [Rhodoferax ferrireducens]|uniref:WD40/YVTN/BNR-like repeat-containing protein n=1 Tax=Rhodoferax ferrireducens TaxID=192843 RepID=UPI000E0CE8D7|nr:YCF48-related protein [Rhodoferax ferrireducens]